MINELKRLLSEKKITFGFENAIYELNEFDKLYKKKEDSKMKFELGKYYKHTTGTKLHICGLAETYIHGHCFIGENEDGSLSPIGKTEENAVNYKEITRDQFINDTMEESILKASVKIGLDIDGDIVILNGRRFYVNIINQEVKEIL